MMNFILGVFSPYIPYYGASPLPEQIVNLLNEAQNSSDKLRDSWDVVFSQVMAGGMFALMVFIAKIILSFAVAIFIYKFLKKLNGNEVLISYESLIGLCLVLILLSNEGALLKTNLQGLRYMTNTIALLVQQQLSADISGLSAIHNLTLDARAAEVAKAQIRVCLTEESQDLQTQCLDEAIATAEQTAVAIEEATGLLATASRKLGELRDSLIGGFSSVVGSAYESVILFVLNGIQSAFTYLMETGIVLVCLFAPLALALSIFNMQAFSMWLSSFFSFAVAKIAFALIISIVSILHVNAGLPGGLAYSIFLAIIAPSLSLKAASMAGFQSFNLLGTYGGRAASQTSRAVVRSYQVIAKRLRAMLRGNRRGARTPARKSSS